MSNRIVQYWKDLDTLVAASSARAVAEPQRLAASPFSSDRPLELFIDRRYLRTVVAVSVKQMRDCLKQVDEGNTEVIQQIEQEVARRDAFLKWLATEDQTAVYVQLSPAAEFPAARAPGE